MEYEDEDELDMGSQAGNAYLASAKEPQPVASGPNPQIAKYLEGLREQNRKRDKERAFANFVETAQKSSANFGTLGGVTPTSNFSMGKVPEAEKVDPKVLAYLGKGPSKSQSPEQLALMKSRSGYLEAKTKQLGEPKPVAISPELEFRKKRADEEDKRRELAGQDMPIETRTQIETLSRRVANNRSATNVLDAELKKFNEKVRAGDEDAALAVGQGLLKQLNSLQGSDAVGAEEAKRLGSFLEYKMLNFRGKGSFIGRDLDLFSQQLADKLDSARSSMTRTEADIATLRSGQRPTYGKTDSLMSPSSGEALAAPQTAPSKPLEQMSQEELDAEEQALLERQKNAK
jgi:hypothetical protein